MNTMKEREFIAKEWRDERGILHRREVGQELVRCKECKWRDKDNQGEDYCTYVKGLADINEDSFCSWGERSK